jgi:hypothetical protein
MAQTSTDSEGATPAGTGLRAQRLSQYRSEIANARNAGGTLRMWALIAVVVGFLGAIAIAVSTVAGWIDVEQGVEFLLLTSVTTIVSGTASYASGWNVALGASRLEMSLDDE